MWQRESDPREADLEAVVLDSLADLDWSVIHDLEIAAGASASEREDYREAVLAGRLALYPLRPAFPVIREAAGQKTLATAANLRQPALAGPVQALPSMSGPSGLTWHSVAASCPRPRSSGAVFGTLRSLV
jgi:hypothetical protein